MTLKHDRVGKIAAKTEYFQQLKALPNHNENESFISTVMGIHISSIKIEHLNDAGDSFLDELIAVEDHKHVRIDDGYDTEYPFSNKNIVYNRYIDFDKNEVVYVVEVISIEDAILEYTWMKPTPHDQLVYETTPIEITKRILVRKSSFETKVRAYVIDTDYLLRSGVERVIEKNTIIDYSSINASFFSMMCVAMRVLQTENFDVTLDDLQKTLEHKQEAEVRAKRLYDYHKRSLESSIKKLTDSQIAISKLEERMNKTTLENKSGFVYFLQEINGEHYKIGRTKNPNNRLRTFNVKLPYKVQYLFLIPTEDMYKLEKILHDKFSVQNVNGEWFDLSQEDLELIQLQYETITEQELDIRKFKKR